VRTWKTARRLRKLEKAVWLIAIWAGAVLYFAQDVIIPVAMALFLALLLTPLVEAAGLAHVRRGLAVATVRVVVSLPPG
jgi:predicted PurR-regulated permease PerM